LLAAVGSSGAPRPRRAGRAACCTVRGPLLQRGGLSVWSPGRYSGGPHGAHDNQSSAGQRVIRWQRVGLCSFYVRQGVLASTHSACADRRPGYRLASWCARGHCGPHRLAAGEHIVQRPKPEEEEERDCRVVRVLLGYLQCRAARSAAGTSLPACRQCAGVQQAAAHQVWCRPAHGR